MDKVKEISSLIVDCFKGGSKALTFGVGGNAANAIHFAAELSGKFEEYEDSLPCICLCENPSVLTAITNDFGWEHVFERQIKGLAKRGDVVIAFSIGTNGDYLHNAFKGCIGYKWCPILICGKVTKPLIWQDKMVIWELDSLDTPWVQEEQLRIIHRICGEVKSRMS